MKVQGQEIDVKALDTDSKFRAPLGCMVEHDKSICMTVADAKKYKLTYITHYYGTYGAVAFCRIG